MKGKYKKIQFLGMAIATIPGSLRSVEETSDDGRYLGTEDRKEDLQNRLDLLRQAIETAYGRHDPDGQTLKVFAVPEFYFRGNRGAYFGSPEEIFHDYFQGFLESVLAQEQYHDWLFVLGTLLTSECRIDLEREPVKSLFPMGDYLLDLYNRLYPQNTLQAGKDGKRIPSLREMLDILEEENYLEGSSDDSWMKQRAQDQATDKPFLSIMKAALDYCDSKADIVVKNRCFIVEGGTKHPRIIQVQKKYKSKEDFILNALEGQYIQSITCYPEIADRSEQKETDGDVYSIFEYEGIRFGVEICLDHGRGRLKLDSVRHPENRVDVQLVISCGMDVRPQAVTADTGGFVFNCDGEYVLPDAAENGEHCHTILKKVIQRADGQNPAILSPYLSLPEDKKIRIPYQDAFYACKSYEIHLYPPCELLPNQPKY